MEEGEECDCGYTGDKTCKDDQCCHGRATGNDPSNDCKLQNGTCRLVDITSGVFL